MCLWKKVLCWWPSNRLEPSGSAWLDVTSTLACVVLYSWIFGVSVLIVLDELIGTTAVKTDGMRLTGRVCACVCLCTCVSVCAHECVLLLN